MGKRAVQAFEAICDRCGAIGDTAYDGRYRARIGANSTLNVVASAMACVALKRT